MPTRITHVCFALLCYRSLRAPFVPLLRNSDLPETDAQKGYNDLGRYYLKRFIRIKHSEEFCQTRIYEGGG